MLVEICGRCGDEIVNDNRNRGNLWLHLAGDPQDGHLPTFGTPTSDEVLRRLFHPKESEKPVPQAAFVVERVPVRDATDEEIGTSNRLGRRQLINHAKRNGFTVTARFARGPWIDQYGNPVRTVDSLVIYGWHESDGRQFHCWWATKASGEYEFQRAFLAGTQGLTSSADALDYVKGKTSLSRS
jgi:hypothetical protein